MNVAIALGYGVASAAALHGWLRRHDRRVLEQLPNAPGSTQDPGLLARVGRHVPGWALRSRSAQLAGALSLDPDREAGKAVLLGVAGALLAMTMAGGGMGGRGPLAAALAAGGFVLPGFVLARRIGELRRAASLGIPDLLDVVALCVSAGLTPRLALERARRVVGGPLADELERARLDVALGAPWREALRSAARRTGLGELRRLAAVLERSDRLGSPVAVQLRALARDVRRERRFRAEERARRAPVVMLFPLVLCILPAFVIAAVIPAVLATARGIG